LKLARLWSALLTLTLAGCAIGTKTAAQVEPDPVGACQVWRIITWADGDTDETLKQVKANNAARRAYCGSPVKP
jgi:hypothetical protein